MNTLPARLLKRSALDCRSQLIAPGKPVLGRAPRPVLGTDPAVIPQACKGLDDMSVIDLAFVGLGTARHGRDLDVTDQGQERLEPPSKVALGDLEVIAVEHQLYVAALGTLDDGGGLTRMGQ